MRTEGESRGIRVSDVPSKTTSPTDHFAYRPYRLLYVSSSRLMISVVPGRERELVFLLWFTRNFVVLLNYEGNEDIHQSLDEFNQSRIKTHCLDLTNVLAMI